MKNIIIELLNEILPEASTTPLTEADICKPLTDRGFDSLTFIKFVLLLEERLDIEILDSDLLYRNFATIEKIVDTLKKYE